MRLKAHQNIWIITGTGNAFPGEFLGYMPGKCIKTSSGKFGLQTWPRCCVKPRATVKREVAA